MRFNGIFTREITHIHAAALLLGAAGFLSRILGVLRDRMLAGKFGAGRELDIYVAAFQIPDFMAVVFLLGAGGAAILPIFQEYAQAGEEKARRFISQLSTFFLLGSLSLCGVAFFLLPFFAPLLIPGFSLEEQSEVVRLSRIMLLSPILLGFSSLFSSVVQARGRFFSYAASPIFYNIGIIVGIVGLVPLWGISGLAAGVVLGAFLHVLIQAYAIARIGFFPRFVFFGEREGARRVAKTSFPRALSLSLANITLIAIFFLGSFLAPGSIAVFHLAQNLYFVPIGIFGLSYATALFPRLSRAHIAKDGALFFQDLFLGIRTILFWMFPISVLFIVLRAHIVRVALGAGVFSWEDTRLSAATLLAFSITLFAGALIPLLTRAFYAAGETRLPFFANAAGSFLSILLASLFTFWIREGGQFGFFLGILFRISDLPDREVLGLALGFSLGLLINMLLLCIFLRAFLRRVLDFFEPFPWVAVAHMGIAACFAGVAAYVARASFSETLPLITFWRVFGQGVFSAGAGFVCYFGALYVLGSEDVRHIMSGIRKRVFRMRVFPGGWNGSI